MIAKWNSSALVSFWGLNQFGSHFCLATRRVIASIGTQNETSGHLCSMITLSFIFKWTLPALLLIWQNTITCPRGMTSRQIEWLTTAFALWTTPHPSATFYRRGHVCRQSLSFDNGVQWVEKRKQTTWLALQGQLGFRVRSSYRASDWPKQILQHPVSKVPSNSKRIGTLWDPTWILPHD